MSRNDLPKKISKTSASCEATATHAYNADTGSDMARASGRSAPKSAGGAQGGKKRPHSSSNNRAQAAQRLQRKEGGSAGPSSVLGVYDYVVNEGEASSSSANGGKKRKRGDRALRRAKAGHDDEEVNGEASASTRNHKRRRHDGDGQDDDEDEDGEEDLSDSERVRVPTLFDDDDDDGDGIKPFEGEDEEIDSDEAFGESDEERFEGWAKRGSRSKDADDDDDDEEDDEDARLDLEDILGADEDGEEGEEDDDDDEGGDDDADINLGDDYDASGADGFQTVKAGPADFFDFDEAQASAAASGPVTLEDLLAPLSQDASIATAELRKRVSALATENRTKRGKEGGGAVDKQTGALSAPLPAILQDRVDRAAAYEATRAQVEGWQPTLKRLREAEHLSFPLQKPAVIKSSNASLVSSMLSTKVGSAVRSALETQTADLLRAAEMTDSQITKREDLAMNKLDPAVVEERRKELARMRELMFRAEQKAKRVSKIKSKSYRRIARKEKEKLKQKMAEAGLSLDDDLDGEVDYEAEQADRIKAERERAKERATLKHKNTGQWAKQMIGRRKNNEDTTAAIEEQLRRGEQLRKRIQDEDSGDDDDSFDSDDERDETHEGGEASITGRAFDELATFEAAEAARAQADEDEIDAAAQGGGVGKGIAKVMQMKFMRDARARADQGVREAADELRVELARAEEEAGSSGGDEGAADSADGKDAAALRGRVARIGGNFGRSVFAAAGGSGITTGPSGNDSSAKQKNGKTKARNDDDDDGQVGSLSSGIAVAKAPSKGKAKATADTSLAATSAPEAHEASSSNPWLQASGSGSAVKLSKKKNEVIVGRNSDAIAKAANRIERHASKGDAARRAAAEDARVEIDDDTSLAVPSQGPKSKRSATRVDVEDEDLSDEDGDDGLVAVSTSAVNKKGGGVAFSQRDLVAEAFAGDDVAAQFAEEKRALVEADAPKEEDNSLPGWGSWSGKGVKQTPAQKARQEANRKKHTKKIAGLDPSKRKDAGMEHVIINERVDKKAEKYKVKDLPHPFTSAAQYDMVMRNSMGAEWNTRTQHQRMTLPRVVTKPGKAIQPIERKF
ncbi:hypothetical protein V8E36_008269 [Tilletia maclaganii]